MRSCQGTFLFSSAVSTTWLQESAGRSHVVFVSPFWPQCATPRSLLQQVRAEAQQIRGEGVPRKPLHSPKYDWSAPEKYTPDPKPKRLPNPQGKASQRLL